MRDAAVVATIGLLVWVVWQWVRAAVALHEARRRVDAWPDRIEALQVQVEALRRDVEAERR